MCPAIQFVNRVLWLVVFIVVLGEDHIGNIIHNVELPGKIDRQYRMA